jgi:outer membrane protein assembly factor BamB
MSAFGRKVMDLAEQQGLLDGRAIAELRKQVAESKFVITPEAIAKVLVDHGHLTPFQARRLVSQALGDEPDPVEQRVVEKAKPPARPRPVEDLTFADPADRAALAEQKKHAPVQREEPKPAPSPQPAHDLPIGKRHSPKETKPTVEPPVEGSTADDFVELESIDAAPHARGNRWKTDAPNPDLQETVELTPLDLAMPAGVPAPDLEPIDDLFAPNPIPAPAPRRPTPAQPKPAARSTPSPLARPSVHSAGPASNESPPTLRPVRPKNVWDSPLLLIGGGALGVILILFAVLFYALTRGTAADVFNQAEDEYRGGAYTNAIAIYDRFLKQYPSDPNASLARVRRGMAALRQVTDDGKNPRLGLETANQVLPAIEKEEQFSEARPELATILPDIADGFATDAAEATEPARKADLLKLAGEALALVNNPAYLPTSLRKEREGHIGRIVDKLKAAERGIQQEKDLAAAVENIAAATEKGDAAGAYELQAKLLRVYPALATNSRLVAATKQIGEKERQLVKVSSDGPAPITTDHSPGSDRVVLSFALQAAATASGVQPVFLLIEGAVYGVDAANGRVLWRRFVGHETTNQPVSLEVADGVDAVLIDNRRHELMRLQGANGQLVWRRSLDGNAFGPVLADGKILASTRKGSLLAIDAASGELRAAAQLPQGVMVAPAARQSRVCQLGEHSTLFVFDANSLACTETVYLGHQAGEILVPPLAVLDQVLVVKSPADDYTEIHVLSPDAKTKRLAALNRPKRLKGRVVTPLSVLGARVAAITDLGQVAVYDVDSANEAEHLRFIAGLDATETTPRRAYCEFTKSNRLWVASHRRTLFDVQSALSQLSRLWTENHDDSFLAPLQVQGDTLVQARRRGGISAVLVEGSRVDTGSTQWTTHIAAPLAALAPSTGRQSVDALTGDGRLYPLSNAQFEANVVQRPSFPDGAASREIHADASLSADGQTLVWTESSAAGRIYFYDLGTGGKPLSFSLPAQAVAPAATFGGGAIAPLANGGVLFVPATTSGPKVAPFLPPLVPDALPRWTQPAVFADNAAFVISDGRGTVYAVSKRDRPQPHLASVGEAKTKGPIQSTLVLSGSTAIGVVHQERSDAVAGFDSRAVATFEPVPLQGRVTAGPFAVGGLVLVAAEPDGLVCLSSEGKVRWQQAANERGPIAGPPLATSEGDLLVASQSGMVCLLDAATGRELARHDVGEPLFGPTCLLGANVFLSGSDGVVHRIQIPPRP